MNSNPLYLTNSAFISYMGITAHLCNDSAYCFVISSTLCLLDIQVSISEIGFTFSFPVELDLISMTELQKYFFLSKSLMVMRLSLGVALGFGIEVEVGSDISSFLTY